MQQAKQEEIHVSDNLMFLYAGYYESVDESEAALIVVGEATVERAVEEATERAKKQMKKEVRAEAKEIERAIDKA